MTKTFQHELPDTHSRFPYSVSDESINAPPHQQYRITQRASQYREYDPIFSEWADGYGVIHHSDQTQVRIYELVDALLIKGAISKRDDAFRILFAADKISNAAMWLVAHMAYARNVYPDGRDMEAEDFKRNPEGHMGGSLNIVLAYTGYLAANALSSVTRSWMMGQGHCVAGIDATNVLVNNMTSAHAERYNLTSDGLTRLARDFYSYEVRPDGSPASPLGSHVNTHTAGGVMEGGYLGFAELQYMHMPLPGDRLVAFLSDGAFEEQRGADWAPRWWRAGDCGLIAPIMIANGRRIEQRSNMMQDGGIAWFRNHLKLNGFDPIEIDGSDPAAYAWAIIEMEERLTACASAVDVGHAQYPVSLHYAIAEVDKGFGFPGAGTNLAHNLPLGGNPAVDIEARKCFNEGAHRLWVPPSALAQAATCLNKHQEQDRPKEKDHPIASRQTPALQIPTPPWKSPDDTSSHSPMDGIDQYFSAIVLNNTGLRVRLGNPDELRSNRMTATLDLLKHRVTHPEPGIAEAVDGKVITALNEEAVACAALANKGGLNLIISYEAFAVKMLGAIRQELIFARHQHENGRSPKWLTVPVILTSHTWENGKNEQSHQDPTLCEALLGEASDVSHVLFPADWNTALEALRASYLSTGEIWTLVVPKRPLPVVFNAAQAAELVATGALRLRGSGTDDEKVLLVAIGAYQLQEILKASERLTARGLAHSVVYLIEPARFRSPRDPMEAQHMASRDDRERLFQSAAQVRIVLTHTRPEPMLGILRPQDTGSHRTRALGYINRGGTLSTPGMLFTNRCTWAHVVSAVAESLGWDPEKLLTAGEWSATQGTGDPSVIIDTAI